MFLALKRLILRIQLICVIFAPLSSALANPQTESRLNTQVDVPQNLQADWSINLNGISNQNDFKSAQLMRFGADLQFNYWLNSSLFLDFHPVAKFETGSTQSIDGSTKAENTITFKQAALMMLPTANSLISVGALDQSQLHSQIIVGEQAFPELRASVNIYSNRIWKMGPIASLAIPTSTQLAAETGEKEALPNLSTVGLFANLEVNENFYWKSGVNYFQYSQLPQNVMNQSVLFGNTASEDKISDTNFNLKYRYVGIEAATKSQFPLYRSFDGIVLGQYVQNTMAPKELNSAYIVGAGAGLSLSRSLSIESTFNYFRIEPDSSVAYYSSISNYNTNRVGYSANVNFNFKKSKFKVGATYSEAGIIYESLSQSREKQIFITLETANASL